MRSAWKLLPFVLILSACGGDPIQLPPVDNGSTTGTSSVDGGAEPAARAIFHKDNFSDLSDFAVFQSTSFRCLGDIAKTFRVDGDDYTGVPTAFPYLSGADSLSPTTRPTFLKNVSVDITDTYYSDTQSGVVSTDSCSYRGIASTPDPSSCADFDEAPPAAPAPTVAPTATPSPSPFPTSTPTSSQYYNTRFYRVRDDWCANQGPIRNSDSETSKAYVGGVNIDIDRSQLGANEDLLMLVTYQSWTTHTSWPLVLPETPVTHDKTVLEVNLVSTQSSLANLLAARQPRAWMDYDSSSEPVTLKKIATLEDPFGSLRTEQVYIPLSQSPTADRIRIDRVRGSYQLFQIDLYRLGNRAN